MRKDVYIKFDPLQSPIAGDIWFFPEGGFYVVDYMDVFRVYLRQYEWETRIQRGGMGKGR